MSNYVFAKRGPRTKRFSKHNWKMLLGNKDGWMEIKEPTPENEAKKTDMKADLRASMGVPAGLVDAPTFDGVQSATPPTADETHKAKMKEAKSLEKEGRNIEALIAYRAARDMKRTSASTKKINTLTVIVENHTTTNELIASAKEMAALDPVSALEMLGDASTIADKSQAIDIAILKNDLNS
jgi:hypothetical protein